MAFYPWVDDNSLSNVESAADFGNEVTNGFQANAVAGAKSVNSALRQANLVVAALMKALDLDTFSFRSTLSEVQTALATKLKLYRHVINISYTRNDSTEQITCYCSFTFINKSNVQINTVSKIASTLAQDVHYQASGYFFDYLDEPHYANIADIYTTAATTIRFTCGSIDNNFLPSVVDFPVTDGQYTTVTDTVQEI